MTPRSLPVRRSTVIFTGSREPSKRVRNARVRPYLVAFERQQARNQRAVLERVLRGLVRLDAGDRAPAARANPNVIATQPLAVVA